MFGFITKWLNGRGVVIPSAPSSPDWTQENAAELQKFLNSQTGVTLMAKARSLECASAIHACTGEPLQGRIVQPGHAAGLSFAVNWLQSLATVDVGTVEAEEDFEAYHHASDMLRVGEAN